MGDLGGAAGCPRGRPNDQQHHHRFGNFVGKCHRDGHDKLSGVDITKRNCNDGYGHCDGVWHVGVAERLATELELDARGPEPAGERDATTTDGYNDRRVD